MRPLQLGLLCAAFLLGCGAPDERELGDAGGGSSGGLDDGSGKADHPSSLVNCRGSVFTEHGSRWHECRIYGQPSPLSALQPGEIVWTIDDGVSTATASLAESLGESGVPATFFPIARSLTETRDDGTLELGRHGLARLTHIVQPKYEHTLANHTWSHISGFGSNSTDVVRDEVTRAHFVLTNALAALGASDRFYPAFRAPGNSWTPQAARALSIDTLAGYRGPFAWDFPDFGEEDFRCWSQGLSVEQCAQSYLDEFQDEGRGILLIHSSAQSAQMTEFLLDEFAELSRARQAAGQPCIKFVPLACAYPDDRPASDCGEARACFHDLHDG